MKQDLVKTQNNLLPTLKELSNKQPSNIHLKSLIRGYNIDFDVYLPTAGEFLQRGYVWNDLQKSRLIESVLIDRFIPAISTINLPPTTPNEKDTLEIIDGKQRLSTMIDFVKGVFAVTLLGNDYHFNDLPQEYKVRIEMHPVLFSLVYESYSTKISDLDKANWFDAINFFDTPQDLLHIQNIKNKLSSK